MGTDNVHRPQARELVHTILVDMAQVDGVSEDERSILVEIEQAWGLKTIR